MNTQHIDSKLWELISSKEYILLNDEEKAFVQTFVSEEEYTNWRKTQTLTSKSYKEEFEAYRFNTIRLKNKLDKQFINNNEQGVIPIWNRPIPLWQAAAIWACILMGAGWYISGLKTSHNELPLLAKADTIFVPVESMPMHDTVYLQVLKVQKDLAVVVSSPQMKVPDQIHVKKERMVEKSWSSIEQDLNTNKTKGQSTSEDTISGKFMIGVL